MVGRSISGTQKDVDTKSDSDRCVAMAADGLQLSTFRVSKDEPGRRWERDTISMRPPITLVKTFKIQETSRSPQLHASTSVQSVALKQRCSRQMRNEKSSGDPASSAVEGIRQACGFQMDMKRIGLNSERTGDG